MKRSVNILGTKYEIKYTTSKDDKSLEDIGGYVDFYSRLIVIDIDDTDTELHDFNTYVKGNVRHEIVHAFLYESGLAFNSNTINGAWAMNEEMVDWIARQGPKIYKAWEEAEVL